MSDDARRDAPRGAGAAPVPEPPRDRRRRRRRGRRFLRRVLPFAVLLAAGGAVVAWIFLSRPEPPQKRPQASGVLVETVTVERERVPVEVPAQGEVVPALRVTLTPQVSGEVSWVSPDLVPGGLVGAGDLLLRVSPREFRLALAQAQAEVERARVQLAEARARAEVADREWQLLQKLEGLELPPLEDADPLARHEPQVAAALQALQAARNRVARARLDVERTALHAPFDAFVQDEQVDLGQVVGPGSASVTLVGTEHFRVHAAIPVGKVRFVEAPGVAGGSRGSAVRVWHDTPTGRIERAGRVLRLVPELDEGGHQAQVVIEIEDPLGHRGTGPPLLLGAWVAAAIDAGELTGVRVPRSALRQRNRVHVRGPDGRLQIREIELLWEQPDAVLVGEGLSGGEAVVTTRIPDPFEGMALRVAERGDDGDAGEPGAAAARRAPRRAR